MRGDLGIYCHIAKMATGAVIETCAIMAYVIYYQAPCECTERCISPYICLHAYRLGVISAFQVWIWSDFSWIEYKAKLLSFEHNNWKQKWDMSLLLKWFYFLTSAEMCLFSAPIFCVAWCHWTAEKYETTLKLPVASADQIKRRLKVYDLFCFATFCVFSM